MKCQFVISRENFTKEVEDWFHTMPDYGFSFTTDGNYSITCDLSAEDATVASLKYNLHVIENKSEDT